MTVRNCIEIDIVWNDEGSLEIVERWRNELNSEWKREWLITHLIECFDCDWLRWYWLRDRPGGRVPEVIVNRGLSPEMIGEIENDCPLMRVNENWE